MLNSIEVPGAPDIPGETKPRTCSSVKDGSLVGNIEGVTNMHQNLLYGMKVAGENADCLGYRPRAADGSVGPYKWVSYKSVKDIATNIGSGMSKLGMKNQECFGIYSPNCIEWSYVEHASYIYNTISVPMYDTLGIEAVKHMANETEMNLIFASPDKLSTVLKIWSDLPSVKNIIVFGDVSDTIKEDAASKGPEGSQVISLDDLIELGKKDELAPLPETPGGVDDICTICYTSGTTGKPKGVVLTNMTFLSTMNAASLRIKVNQIPNIGPGDTHFSILPLAHCLERCLHAVLIGFGARIGFGQGDIRKILDDINALQPSVLVGVPRIFNRIHDQIWAQVRSKGGIAKTLFTHAYSTKKSNLKNGTNRHWLWDRVVFKTVREKFGGKIRLIISGSAPISHEVMDFLRVAFSITVFEGYGLTETTGPCGITLINDMEAGNVGCTLGNCWYKLVDVPDMGYTSKDKPYPRGEVQAKGNNIFREYYKQPELTAEAKDADGWVATGDIGMFDKKGNLVIIDRKKNMFKLAQGEYVTPERIENVFTNCALIEQAYVHGDSLQSQLVGIMVPSEEFLRKDLADDDKLSSLANESFADLCKNKDVIKHMCKVIDAWGRSNDLKGYEIPKNVYLETEPFSIENDILTPTLKIKRPQAKKFYEETLKKLYDELAEQGKN